MGPALAQNRHLLIITIILAFILITFYIINPSDRDSRLFPSTKNEIIEQQHIQAQQQQQKQAKKKSSILKKHSICNKVDVKWLASDRVYWDGWNDKAMFIRPDGTYTRGNVYIHESESICIAVLLGPTPAQGSTNNYDHLGPKDSIALFVNGNQSKVTVQLDQHPDQPNVYISAVQFNYADMYSIDALTEYRSYFWEAPVLHTYRPHSFKSQNNLIVKPLKSLDKTLIKKPACDLRNKTLLTGAWIGLKDIKDKSRQQKKELYIQYEDTELALANNNKVFVPTFCQFHYTSAGQASRCLGKKTVHVWADNNVKRNLKAITPLKNWCNIDTLINDSNDACVCNDDNEDAEDLNYPWVRNSSIPLKIGNSFEIDAKVYYNNVVESIIAPNSLHTRMKQYIQQQQQQQKPKADVVVIGLGNADIEATLTSPEEFAKAIKQFLTFVRKEVYPTQKLIVRTPQYFCCGTIGMTSWNTGRSRTFTSLLVKTVQSMDKDVLLWDVYSLGTDDTTCLSHDSSYTKRNVINVENQQLFGLLCA